ncbi:MAG: signal transduction histidine kinase, partial [Planctomycetota bacterium]
LARENAAMRARTEFLSGVTHELKTPVAAMRLIADVLHDDDVKPKRQREYFAMMAAEAARLSALIDNVLDLGQIERGERSYDLREEDAADVVREAVNSYLPLGQQAGLAIELQEGVATATAQLDRGAIIQALLNLLENARKYAAAGKRIDVTTKNGNGQFTILVRDHGPGVPEHEREAIFHRFQRGKAEASGSIAGVGLGLFLSRSILEYHGGTLTCLAPKEGRGSLFQLTLPLQPSNTAP